MWFFPVLGFKRRETFLIGKRNNNSSSNNNSVKFDKINFKDLKSYIQKNVVSKTTFPFFLWP